MDVVLEEFNHREEVKAETAMSNGSVQRGYAAVKTWLERVVGVVFISIGLKLAFSGRGS